MTYRMDLPGFGVPWASLRLQGRCVENWSLEKIIFEPNTCRQRSELTLIFSFGSIRFYYSSLSRAFLDLIAMNRACSVDGIETRVNGRSFGRRLVDTYDSAPDLHADVGDQAS